MTQTRSIIHDCDPGVDDVVALLLALASTEQLELLGISIVAGNVGLNPCIENALKTCELAGRNDIPVYPGCERPMIKPLLTAPEVHGANGIGGVHLPKPGLTARSQHAVDFIIDTVKSRDDITLCPTGPLTNIAMALIKAPEIAPRIRDIVLMGGAMNEGNVTPAAEFNFFVDPHAAHVVFSSQIPIVMFGLNLTHQVVNTPARLDAIRAIGSAPAIFVADILSTLPEVDLQRYGGTPLHDPNVIMYLLCPDLYKGKDCFVEIIHDSGPAQGQSVVDWWGRTGRTANAKVIYQADVEGFYRELGRRLENLLIRD